MSDTQIEITPQELKMLPQDSYQLIDTRDDASIAYGMANGAIHIPQEAVVDRLTSKPELLKGRTAILYCARGILSMELASELNRRGIPSRSLTGGYNGWLLATWQAICRMKVKKKKKKPAWPARSVSKTASGANSMCRSSPALQRRSATMS